MVKGFIHYKEGKIPFVIDNYSMELFTDDPLLSDFTKEYNFQTDYILAGECFDSGSFSRKITINVERSMGSTCYLNCFLINQIGHDNLFDTITFKSELLDCIFRYKYNYLDFSREGENLSAGTKEVYSLSFSIGGKPYNLKYIIGLRNHLGLLESFEMAGETVVSLDSADIKECYKVTTLLERFMKFTAETSDAYFQHITLMDKDLPAAFFFCKSISERAAGKPDTFFHDFDVMTYVPKIINNLAKELGNKITTSMTLGHIGNFESMFTPQRFIEQIMAFEYLFEKLEPQKSKLRSFHLVHKLEYMFKTFPNILSTVHKSEREISEEIKKMRVDIVHGHAYYYDFSTNHKIQYYMLRLDKLLKCMNLRLAGFTDDEIRNFRPY